MENVKGHPRVDGIKKPKPKRQWSSENPTRLMLKSLFKSLCLNHCETGVSCCFALSYPSIILLLLAQCSKFYHCGLGNHPTLNNAVAIILHGLLSLRAGSRWSTTGSAGGKSRGEGRETKKRVCYFFISTPETAKNEPANFHRKYELCPLRFFGKIMNLFHNNMQTRYPLLIESFAKEKPSKFTSGQDTHLILSDIA